MRQWLALGVVCVGLTALLAEPKAAKPIDPQLTAAIERLASDRYREREQAGTLLLQRGDEAQRLLRDALGTASPEARRRITVLLQRIDERLLLEPRRVTIVCRDRPTREVIADLVRQSRYDVRLHGAPPVHKLSLNLDRIPFWEAIDKICAQAGIIPTNDDGTGAINLMNQDAIVPHVSYSGPFRFVPQGFQLNKNVQLGQLPRNAQNRLNQNNANFSLSFMVTSEPRMPLLGLGQPTVIEATDDQGRSLKMPAPEGQISYYPNSGNRSIFQHSQVQLTAPTKDAQMLKRIKCRVPVTIISEQRPVITVENILKVKKKLFSAGPIDLEVVQVSEPNPKQFSLELTVKNAKIADNDYGWVNSLYQRIELHDASGRKYQPQGVNNNEQNSPTAIHGNFMYGHTGNAELGPPVRLVYVQWLTVPHLVEFEMRDLPLP